MRHKRSHFIFSQGKNVTHIHDIDPTFPEEQHMTEAQQLRVIEARKLWPKRNEIASSYLMEVCCAHSMPQVEAPTKHTAEIAADMMTETLLHRLHT